MPAGWAAVVAPIVAVALVGLVFASNGTRAGVGRQATPAAGSDVAVACAVEPRPLEEIIALFFDPQGTPLPTPPPPSPYPSEAQLPQGRAVDPATVAALDATLTELFACVDDNQTARAFALMTDKMVRRFGPDLSNPRQDTPEENRALLAAELVGTPGPVPPGERTGPLAVRDARLLPDRRVGAILDNTDEGEVGFLVFERRDARWLLADAVEIEAGKGTPSP
jgi:hypothetical protein